MKVVKPPRLNIGDTIGIVASSTPVLPSSKENYEKGKKVIYDLGFRIKEGNTIGPLHWWMAGSPKEVAEDLNQMFPDKNIKAIIAQNGGYSAISVLEHLDYEVISKNPKPFMGFSDMTIYHLAILAKTGMIGFHMDYLSNLTGEFFLKFLTQSTAPGVIQAKTKWEQWKKGKAQGHLIGGLLERISVLSGTKYFPDLDWFDGSILFWEEIGRDLSEIYQYLYQLKNMGIFERINGMLIGKIKYIKPLKNEEFTTPYIKEMVLDILKEYRFPIMANMDFGHITGNIPLPIGIKVSFDTSKKELKFLEGAVI